MSSEACLITMIGDLIALKRTLSDLQVEYEETKTLTTADGSSHKVEVVIKDPNGRLIGLEKTKKGEYQFVADTKGLTKEQLKKQQVFINKIKQKYAYSKVIAELKKQGYMISEEERVQKNTIRLVARKWS
ncbi:MAG: hypothetical protein A2Y00_06960 [Omnitrophica WOR_2 bacterium GWF2_43_52]|nr:MAG: hypothetical protein A2Y01_05255 [Omnitrophica WOR_2 bacterium GWC2_44_8]OGX20161.1 MAG: hypothetical protein A2Y00_06960 [Omnitrophica WOR_2 bacterium GWF2_43_52]OGX53317.1 MAG: hypothetical protein A2460_04075 [Omnitrophica WOR_2 bacterium RIFOXYC2_FULL_43_9]HAH19286.1 hypothetical protein [Candidatus Omnitrophota bacterium]HBG63691.1 hypothetical protein [Candidatus Omnitrophota bacterium]